MCIYKYVDIYSYIYDAFREINIAPARKLPQKETSFPTNHFRCSETVYTVIYAPTSPRGPILPSTPTYGCFMDGSCWSSIVPKNAEDSAAKWQSSIIHSYKQTWKFSGTNIPENLFGFHHV